MGGLTSTDAVEPDVASASGPCCDGRGRGFLDSRWRIVGADKMPGCGAAAGPPHARASSSFLLTPPPSSSLNTIHRGLPLLHFLLFGCALPPVAAFRDASTTSDCFDASPSAGRDRSREPSELACAREGAGAGIMEVPGSVVDSKMKALSMRLDLVTWSVVWVDACWLAGLALARRGGRWRGLRWSSGCVSGLRLRRGSSLRGRLLGSSSGGRSALRGSFLKRCGRIIALFRLGSSTGGGAGLLSGLVLLGCVRGVLVVKMISLDLFFVPLGRLLGLEGFQ